MQFFKLKLAQIFSYFFLFYTSTPLLFGSTAQSKTEIHESCQDILARAFRATLHETANISRHPIAFPHSGGRLDDAEWEEVTGSIIHTLDELQGVWESSSPGSHLSFLEAMTMQDLRKPDEVDLAASVIFNNPFVNSAKPIIAHIFGKLSSGAPIYVLQAAIKHRDYQTLEFLLKYPTMPDYIRLWEDRGASFVDYLVQNSPKDESFSLENAADVYRLLVTFGAKGDTEKAKRVGLFPSYMPGK